jgi:hypothetical protein
VTSTYVRAESGDLTVVDRWDGGVDWMVHREERDRRASCAIRGEDGGVWAIDPLDAPGVDDLRAELGEVGGVAVLSNDHARDAGSIARRHGVPVSLPAWIDRVDARIERCSGRLPGSGFRLRETSPSRGGARRSPPTGAVRDRAGAQLRRPRRALAAV